MHHYAWLTGCRVCVFAAAVAWATGSASAAEPAPAAAAAAEPTPSSHSILAMRADLAAIGVEIYRQRLDTPGASMSFEVTVEKNSNAGQFVQAECVVLRDPEAMKDLVTTDSSADLAAKVSRRNVSEKLDSTFLVLGREVQRAYLVFEFSNAGKSTQRYLLPVTAVPRHRA